MGRIPANLEECCTILGVSPGSTREEMKLAFALNRRDLDMAGYDVRAIWCMIKGLAIPKPVMCKAPVPKLHPVRRRKLSSTTLAVTVLLALLVVVYIFVWPQYGYKLRRFRANDSLVEARSGEPYATVVEVSNTHEFPNGKVAPAYRLKLARDGSEVWYPVNDVHYLCVRD